MTNFTENKIQVKPLTNLTDMATNNFRVRVMKYAWQIFKATSASLSECLKKAWQLYHLAKAMRERVVKFSFLKADGTIREALGTLRDLPAGATLGGKKVTKPSYKTLAYFDTERNSFRCFKVENLISVAI